MSNLPFLSGTQNQPVEMETKIDPFLKRQLSIARDLSDEDFMNLKFLCQSFIPEGRLEDLNSPQQLFTELKHLGQLNSDRRDTLASLLYHVGRSDLRNRLLGIEGRYLMKRIKRAFDLVEHELASCLCLYNQHYYNSVAVFGRVQMLQKP